MFLAVELICTGGTQMRKTILLAVAAAALIATGFGLTNARAPETSRAIAAAALTATGFGTNARAPETSQGIDPFQIQMTSGKGLPREELVDYTFVFPH
jgi:hypothetical protein